MATETTTPTKDNGETQSLALRPEILDAMHPMLQIAYVHKEILGVAKMLLGSGLLAKKGIQNEYQAYAVMVYGYSFGWDHWAALRNCHIIQGQLGMSSAAMMGLAIKAGVRFTFKESGIGGNDGKRGEWCELLATRPGFPDFPVRWDDEDVRRAGLMKDDSNHKKYPAAMKRWRCIADACRVICPELLAGCVSIEEIRDGFDFEVTPASPAMTRTEALAMQLGGQPKPIETQSSEESEAVDPDTGEVMSLQEMVGVVVTDEPEPKPKRQASKPKGKAEELIEGWARHDPEWASKISAVVGKPVAQWDDATLNAHGKVLALAETGIPLHELYPSLYQTADAN